LKVVEMENLQKRRPIPVTKVQKGESGQGLVEFAMVVPLFLLLVVGIAEFGRAWMTQSILTGAAREAARVAVVPPPGGVSAGIARGNEVLASAGLPPGIAIVPAGNPFGTVTATATYDFVPVVINFIPGMPSTIHLTSRTSMRREY
jgi:hypothetical protein